MASFLDLTTGLPALWAKIKGLITQSDWEEDDTTSSAHVLNRPAVRAGEGGNSVVVGQIEQLSDAKVYTLYLTGEANTLTYTYTTDDTLPSATALKNDRTVVYYADAPVSFKKFQFIDTIDTTNHTITLLGTFSSEALNNVSVQIYYKYKESLGKNSISEGLRTLALSNASHAEGLQTRAVGGYDHAEGHLTRSSGASAHVEGSGTVATNSYAHAEGHGSIANGKASHTEGRDTIASSDYQHVQGKYNIEDANNVYADIVGNGSSSARSNAYTLDWSGNGWYAGKVTIGAQPTADMDVATKKYVDDTVGGIDIPEEVFTVTVTQNPETDGYIADKTHAEIQTALNNGCIPILNYQNKYFPYQGTNYWFDDRAQAHNFYIMEHNAYTHAIIISGFFISVGNITREIKDYSIEIPQPEDDTLVLNLLTEYGYAAPIADASGNVITEDNGTLVLG